MLSSLRNIVRVADLRNKILFTLLVIAIYQLGANVPVPGVTSRRSRRSRTAPKGSGILGFLDLFSGGALARAAVLGLGIMPYITSSIIIQLLGTVIPKFAEWREQGAVGQRKLTQATRYLTVALALMQSSGLVFLLHSGQLFSAPRARPATTSSPNFTVAARAVHHPHLDRRHGVRDVARRAHHPARHRPGHVDPDLLQRRRDPPARHRPHQGRQGLGRVWSSSASSASLLLVAIVFVELGQRRIPVTFARRVQGRRMYGGQSTYIPLKVNQAGVIPIIFASSLLYIPVLISIVLPWKGVRTWIKNNLLSPDRRRLPRPLRPAHHRLHLLLRAGELRPLPAGRHDPQAGRLHPRHPARAADRDLPRRRS